jgi:lauroyl/myristoyl acyltransferase
LERDEETKAVAVSAGVLRLAAWLVSGCLQLLPRRARFATLLQMARVLWPVARRANLGRWHRTRLTSSTADTAVFAGCELLDRRRISYDPQIDVVGEDALAAALQMGRGVVLLTVHGLLSNLLIRFYEADRGLSPTMVAVSDQTSFVSGTGRRPDVLVPSPTFLLRLRTRLRQGGVVFAMVDRAAEDPRALHFMTRHGPVTITDSMLRLAVRLHAPVLFTTCHVHGTAVVLRIEEVRASSGGLPGLTAALVARIEADMGRVAAEG